MQTEEIQQYVGSLVAQISEVLDRVPKPLILIFKVSAMMNLVAKYHFLCYVVAQTNDLLRGIEHTLGTAHNAKSFVRMTKSCTRTIADNARRLFSPLLFNALMYTNIKCES